MRIAICGLKSSSNLGERVIARTLEWIIREIAIKRGSFGKFDFVYVDLLGLDDTAAISTVISTYDNKSLFYGIPMKIAKTVYYVLRNVAFQFGCLSMKNMFFRFEHVMWIRKHYKIDCYYKNSLKDVDLIVIAGAGTLEYSYNQYQEYLLAISEYANENSIPVAINAIGRAGEFNPKDFRCRVIMDAFRKDCVKYISARDNRIEVQSCVGDKLKVKLLADSAFCVSKAYRIMTQRRKGVIGIGLIRGNAFQSYFGGLDEGGLMDLFSEVANKLKEKGYEYEFFTNGYTIDQEFGEQLIKKMGVHHSKLVERPVDDTVLVNTIASYEGIITCRMHSSIVAFSLGVPSVILSWNDKVIHYMNSVGYPDRVILPEQLNSKYIVDHFLEALDNGISEKNRDRMMELAIESVEGFESLFCNR